MEGNLLDVSGRGHPVSYKTPASITPSWAQNPLSNLRPVFPVVADDVDVDRRSVPQKAVHHRKEEKPVQPFGCRVAENDLRNVFLAYDSSYGLRNIAARRSYHFCSQILREL